MASSPVSKPLLARRMSWSSSLDRGVLDRAQERRQHDDGRGEARDLAQHGEEAEQVQRAVLGQEQRRVAEDGRERAEAHGAPGVLHRVDDVAVLVVAAHHVHGVVDADAEGDGERDEVGEIDLHTQDHGRPQEPEHADDQRAQHVEAGPAKTEQREDDQDHAQEREHASPAARRARRSSGCPT